VGDELSDLQDLPPTAGAGEPVSWHASLESVPGPVDIVVVAAPGARPDDVASGVARLGGRGVVVLSAADDTRSLLRAVRRQGLRLVGPESFGLVADAAGRRLNATLRTSLPAAGGLSVFCHSAAAGVGLLTAIEHRGIGLATFLSAGDRADVSGNDAMQFWLGHDGTSTVALYLESIGNPRKFSRVARRLSSSRPVVAVVPAATAPAGASGYPDPTSGPPGRLLEEVLRQSGLVVADDIHGLLDVVQLVESQPLPEGSRLAVLAGSRSLARLVCDVAESHGLTPTRVVVLGTAAGGAEYGAALQEWAVTEDSDALVVAYVPTLGEPNPEVLGAIAAAAASRRPVLACVLGLHGLTAELSAPGIGTVPAFESVDDAARALAAAVRYRRWRQRPRSGPARRPGIDHRSARDLVQRLTADLPAGTTRSLSPPDLTALLACYGIQLWPSRPVRDLAEAMAAAADLGWPVAVKSRDERLRHRLDLGGVRLDVADEDGMRAAVAHLAALSVERPPSDAPFEIQAMAPLGVACVVRAAEDPRYGPVVSFGVAGDAVELLDDVAHGIPPLAEEDLAEMIRSVRAAPRLTGYRDLPGCDLSALQDVLARVSLLKDDLPDIASLVLNPVLVAERGAAVLEAHAMIAEPPRRDRTRRVLPA
jgi:acyl-CoA synthetase (NDP forming)